MWYWAIVAALRGAGKHNCGSTVLSCWQGGGNFIGSIAGRLSRDEVDAARLLASDWLLVALTYDLMG